MSEPEVVHEWRVTGTAMWPGGVTTPYQFTWRNPHWPDPEAEARHFVTSENVRKSIRVLKLEHRTITYTPWAEQPIEDTAP